MAKAFGVTFLILAGFAAFIFFRTGYYEDVKISSGFQGPFLFVYKEHLGPYHKIAPVIDEVENYFKEQNMPCPIAFGRYLHDPKTVEHDRLESHGGCAFLQASEELLALAKKGNYLIDRVQKREYLVATFDGSPSVGPSKVYPKVTDWMKKYGYQRSGPSIELYQTTGKDSVTTRYLFEYK